MRPFAAILGFLVAANAAIGAPGAAAVTERSNTGATAREAALHFLVPGRGFRVLSARVAGDFAIVRFTGALMEGQTNWTDGIVIQRFPFGWQVVDLVRSACLGARGATRAQIAALGAAALPANHDADGTPCAPSVDRGPRDDVVAVRSIDNDGMAIPYVRVADGYALVEWAYPGGGQRVAARKNGRWRILGGSGGAMNAETLHAFGVPTRDACTLIPPASYDAPQVHAMCRTAHGS